LHRPYSLDVATNGEGWKTVGKGIATVNVGGTTVKMSRTLFAPAVRYSLLSVGQMTEEKNWIFVFDKSECRIYDAQSRELIGRTPKRGRLYKLGGTA